jgi:HSP20 family molecular chaperone IbpA
MATQQIQEARGQNLEATRPRQFTPPVDIYENEQELLVVADFPGVSPEAVNVRLDPPEFRIEGRVDNGGEDAPPVLYSRIFRIDERIDADGITAELKNGLLTVHLRKAAALQPRKIAVKAG